MKNKNIIIKFLFINLIKSIKLVKEHLFQNSTSSKNRYNFFIFIINEDKSILDFYFVLIKDDQQKYLEYFLYQNIFFQN